MATAATVVAVVAVVMAVMVVVVTVMVAVMVAAAVMVGVARGGSVVSKGTLLADSMLARCNSRSLRVEHSRALSTTAAHLAARNQNLWLQPRHSNLPVTLLQLTATSQPVS